MDELNLQRKLAELERKTISLEQLLTHYAKTNKQLQTLLNADMVDSIHASATPTANTLLALDSNIKFPDSVLNIDNHVRATLEAAQSIPNTTWTKVLYSTEKYDTKGEYDPTTGRFTATEEGYYNITAGLLSDSVSWDAGELWVMALYANGGIYACGQRSFPAVAGTFYLHSRLAATTHLDAGDYLEIFIYQNQGSDVNTYTASTATATGWYNYLTIDRIR